MNFWQNFQFTSLQKRGVFLLLSGLMAFLTFDGYNKNNQNKKTQELILNLQKESPQSTQRKKINPVSIEINSASLSDWEQLPYIGPVLGKRIIKYRNAIGGFKEIQDLKKVYGLDKEAYEAIEPFLNVEKAHLAVNHKRKKTGRYSATNKTLIRIELNGASADELKKLPGIGEKLSSRIVKFGKSKGGYKSVDELQKVYGLSPEVFENIKGQLYVDLKPIPVVEKLVDKAEKNEDPEGDSYITAKVSKREIPKLKAINLNDADFDMLEALPGIGKKLAGRILSYKKLLGHFYEVDQLRNVYGFSEENFNRAKPYLFVNESQTFYLHDINMANKFSFSKYPFISDSLAIRIVSHRKKIGYFEKWDDLHGIVGINSGIILKLSKYFQF